MKKKELKELVLKGNIFYDDKYHLRLPRKNNNDLMTFFYFNNYYIL